MTLTAQAVQVLTLLWKNRISQTILCLFIVMPHILFWILASSDGFHWWRGTKPASFDRYLRELLVVNSSAVAVFYGFIRVFFWRWFAKASPEQNLKTMRLRLSYTLLPLLYASIAVWGYELLRGRYSARLLVAVVALWVLYDLVMYVLLLLIQFRKPTKLGTSTANENLPQML